ncbi:Cytidine deaminase-like protein [Pseudocohnilembus persalinus]|uniref:Cytidine deaminase-like protein n=1 Tax=Pseudocohnilembus persalinus TaxID=266149 RepID=A0A0V0QSM6_PSEPJ|nr:Cytidine deaminase-like protein [Pseudocohnilembus persalinus]|eukprot:KRX05347.1 Cytidine deaminase-like protein [Pseudocohnilembus persalinus]
MEEKAQLTQEQLHQYFIEEAIKESKKAKETQEGFPFGALIVQNNQIIARGYNQMIHLKDATAHAEIQAIRKAGEILKTWKLNGCILYSSCEPCTMCHTAIIWSGIEKVYFGMSADDLEKINPICVANYSKSEINKQRENRDIPFYQVSQFKENAMKQFQDQLPTDKK